MQITLIPISVLLISRKTTFTFPDYIPKDTGVISFNILYVAQDLSGDSVALMIVTEEGEQRLNNIPRWGAISQHENPTLPLLLHGELEKD